MAASSPDAEDPFGILGSIGVADVPAELSTPVASAPAFADDTARPGDKCVHCLCELIVRGLSYECPECHALFEAADIQDILPVSAPETPGAAANRGRLRVVGAESGWYQPDLDRGNPGKSTDAQKKSTFEELKRYNTELERRGGNVFPLDVLQIVAENYNTIQKVAVKRSETKKYILAALVFNACINKGFTCRREDASELLQLRNHGIASGNDYLRTIDEDYGLEIDMNCDRLIPHITSTFARLEMVEAEKNPLTRAVKDIVDIAEKSHIGFRSELGSKVVAVTYEVLRRAGTPMGLDEVSAKCRIRKHTVRHFLDELADYHSHFEEAYKSHDLDASPGGPEA